MDAVLLSIRDAAKALSLGRSTVYELIHEGRLVTITVGRRRLVRADSVLAFAAGSPIPAD